MDFTGKKLLILGSDYGTYDLAREAKKLGLYVIAADLMETSPTKETADEAWMVSTTDLETLEKKILEEKVDGIVTGASEFNTENCRALCKKLHMPLYCESDEAWSVARNKSKFKKLCKECGVPVATDYYLTDELTDEQLDPVEYPVVVKPVDKSGNRGMSYCHNREELIQAYKYARSISDNPTIVVERQLVGANLGSYYVLAEGEASLCYYTSSYHNPGELANLYSLECMTPCDLKTYLAEVDEGIRKVFKKAGCREGVAWAEYMLDQDGHIYALEMGYRMAGPGLYPLYQMITGFNTMRWQIECALGVKHQVSDLPHVIPAFSDCAASYNLFSNCEGVIDHIEGLEEFEQDPSFVLDIPKRAGGTVRYHANVGVVKIHAENAEELCEKVRRVNRDLKILDKDGKNMFICFDSFEDVMADYARGQKDFSL